MQSRTIHSVRMNGLNYIAKETLGGVAFVPEYEEGYSLLPSAQAPLSLKELRHSTSIPLEQEEVELDDDCITPCKLPEGEVPLPYADILDLVVQEDCMVLAWVLPSGELQLNRDIL